MCPTTDLSDVAPVEPVAMTHPMTYWLESGRGLVLIEGASNEELRAMDAAVWSLLADAPGQRVATLLRFRSLIEVFRAQRLKSLLLQKGFAVIAPALGVAATQRLNATRGFNPLKFERALREAMAAIEAEHRAAAEATFRAAA
ncbi:MAG: hypothetical protein NW223_15060 [Hyphomicrobiaceae bacterium]|nr:hypothetical protein [Hyphomicrobiaceae bacterium]